MSDGIPRVLIEAPAGFRLEDGTGILETDEKAALTVDEEGLSINYGLGSALFFPLRDISSIEAADYSIVLDLSPGEKLVLYHLGYRYDDFCRVLKKACSELSINDYLMKESMIKEDVRSSYINYNAAGERIEEGNCRIRLYETAAVIIRENGAVTRLIYSFINGIRQEDYRLDIEMETGEKWRFEKLGREFSPLLKSLSDALSALSLNTQQHLRQLLPDVSLSVIRKAAELLKDGRAAQRADLENIHPSLWIELEKRLEIAGIKDEYDYLVPLSDEKRVCIGFKRGLMGDLTGEYIWFLIPVYSRDESLPGNVVAMEASGDGGGKATYFFRIMDRDKYRQASDREELAAKAGEFMLQLNRCMLEINFRREPVYLADEKLSQPAYSKYKESIKQMPDLKILREHFLGRVFHRSPEQWKEDVTDIMRFNVNTDNNKAKWKESFNGE